MYDSTDGSTPTPVIEQIFLKNRMKMKNWTERGPAPVILKLNCSRTTMQSCGYGKLCSFLREISPISGNDQCICYAKLIY